MTIKQLKKQLEDLRVPDEAEICAIDGEMGVYQITGVAIYPTMKQDELGSDLGENGAIVLS